VTSNRNLVANFSQQTYAVTVSANPSNGGTVAGDGTYASGSNATVTATANLNWSFTNWTQSGTVVSSNQNYSFTVTSNHNLVANFAYVPPPPSCRQVDSLTLVALYQSTNGANWTTPWTLTQSISTWHGITLNATGCVVEINLNQNNLVGTIPPEIGNLSALIRLNLHNNKLSGSIPGEIGNLSELRQIWLFNNQLSGELPPEIGNLTKLTHLGVGANQLTGSIPASYGNLINLEYLALKNNDLSDCFDTNLANICNAGTDATVSNGNNFDATWSAFCTSGLGDCSSPPTNCSHTDSLILIDLYNATNGPNWTISWNTSQPLSVWHGITLNANGCVEWIDLSNNNLVGTLPSSIVELSALLRLYLHNNQLSGDIPATIGSLTALQHLWLFSNQMSGTLPPEIGSLTNLTHLGIGNNQFTGSIPPVYGNLTNLVYLGLKNNQLSGCYDSNLLNICYVGDDSSVSSGNSFSASWSSFCSALAGCCECRLDIDNNITLYPNPTKNMLHIADTHERPIQQLSIFDMNGKTIRVVENPSNSIDVSGVPQGIYVIKIAIKSGIVYRKILIE